MSSLSQMRSRVCWLLLVFFLCALSLGNSASGAEFQPRLFDESLIAYVYAPNLSALRDKWRDSLASDMLRDPEIAQFLDPVLAPIRELALETTQRTQKPLADLFTLFPGKCTLFLFAHGNPPPKRGVREPSSAAVSFLLVVEFRGSAQDAFQFLTQISTPFDRKSARETLTTLDGIPIYQLNFIRRRAVNIPEVHFAKGRRNDQPQPSEVKIVQESVSQFQCAVVGNNLFIASDASDVLRDAVMQSKTAGGATLPLPAASSLTADDLPTSYSFLISVFPPVLFSSGQPAPRLADDVLSGEPLYLADIPQIALALDSDKGAIAADLLISSRNKSRGLSSVLFLNRSAHLRSLRLIPADATSFYASSLDLERCWELTTTTLHRLSPKYHSIAAQISRTLSTRAAANVENNLLDNLGNEIAYFSLSRSRDDITTYSHALLVNVRNPEQFERTFLRLAVAVGDLFLYRLERLHYQNSDYFLLFPVSPIPQDAALSFAIVDRFLVLSDSARTVHRVIDVSQSSGAQALAGSASFRNLQSRFPPNIVSISYNNYVTLADALEQAPLLRDMLLSHSTASRNYAFMKTMPTSRVLQKYLDGKIAAAILDSNFLHYRIRLWRNAP